MFCNIFIITYYHNSTDPIRSKKEPEDKTEQNLTRQKNNLLDFIFSCFPPILLNENAEAAQTCRYCVLSVIQPQ